MQICFDFWLECSGSFALNADWVLEKNPELQGFGGVTCWFSWFEKLKNGGNKISSAFLSVNQHKMGRGRRPGC